MTTVAPTSVVPLRRGPATRIRWALRDALTMTWRNLLTIRRVPQLLVFATIPASPFHAAAIAALHKVALSGAAGWISRQVMREYLVQLTRPGVLPVALSGPIALVTVAPPERSSVFADSRLPRHSLRSSRPVSSDLTCPTATTASQG